MDPSIAEADRIIQAIWFAIWSGVAMVAFFYLTHRGAEGVPMRWQRWRDAFIERYFMVSAEEEEDESEAVDTPVAEPTTPTTMPDKPVATPNNEGNPVLTDNAQATFQGKIEALATLIKAGKVAQAEGLELVFKCSRSSRTDSPYQRARTALLPLLTPPGPQYPPLSDQQQAAREELDLPPRTS